MTCSRRTFLGSAAAAGAVLALPRLSWGDPSARSGPKRTVVLLHLNGGNDGLNTVIPYNNPRYQRLRPGIGIARGQVRKVNDKVGFHPALSGFETLLKNERLAVVQGAGYPKPSLSHFRATEVWFTAEPEKTPTFGWLGRAFDQNPTERPLRAVALQKEHPLSLAMETPGAVTMTDFGRFRVPSGMGAAEELYRAYANLPGARADLGRAGTQALDVAEKIAALKPASGPLYGPLGDRLKQVVALLEADLGLECIQLDFRGFDTHSNQMASHQRLLTQLGNNLRQYQELLEKRGLGERTVTLVVSEFGRRAKENLSAGTDHGTAGPVFVLGQGVHAGFHGEAPSLDDLDRDNLRYTTDFRRIYASVLREAYDIDPQPVLGDHKPLELFV